MISSVFNRVEGWRLSRQIKQLDFSLLKPDLSFSGGILRIIILLEMTLFLGIPDYSMLCSNLSFKMATYWSVSILPSTSIKTPTPYHQWTTSKLNYMFDLPRSQLLSFLFPYILLSIWPNPIDFSHIWPNNSFPALYHPMLILESKGKPSFAKGHKERRFCLLHYSL